jgi:DNA-binding transcriptional LysR family regulator
MYDLLPDLRILLEIQQPEAIMQAVRAGLGIGCLSQLSLAEYRERGDIVALPVAGRRFARHLYLIVHRQKYRTAAMQHWIRLCGQKAAATPVLPRVSAARKN